jgi:hypothetical protein
MPNQQFLTPPDMAMIERILTEAGLRHVDKGSTMESDAARFLTHQFQEGVTDEPGLRLMLEKYLTKRTSWRRPSRKMAER